MFQYRRGNPLDLFALNHFGTNERPSLSVPGKGEGLALPSGMGQERVDQGEPSQRQSLLSRLSSVSDILSSISSMS